MKNITKLEKKKNKLVKQEKKKNKSEKNRDKERKSLIFKAVSSDFFFIFLLTFGFVCNSLSSLRKKKSDFFQNQKKKILNQAVS